MGAVEVLHIILVVVHDGLNVLFIHFPLLHHGQQVYIGALAIVVLDQKAEASRVLAALEMEFPGAH